MKSLKIPNMNNVYRMAVIVLVAALASCSASTKKEEAGSLNDKKVRLVKLKADQEKLAQNIQQLEAEIAREDPNAAVVAKLVSVTTLAPSNFDHYIDLQGKIITDNIYNVTPRGGAMQVSQIKAVYVKQGDAVRKGQLLLKLDDAVIRQQIEQARINLNYARDLYQRRKNLWDQNIGTEVELITARNNVANAEKSLELLNEQLAFTNVHAEVGGVVETMNARVGGLFTGDPQTGITIVNPNNLKATVDIPENYISRVKTGTPVLIQIPDINKEFNSSVSRISTLIDATSRGFTAEAKVPVAKDVKPNQLAVVKLKDYSASNVIVVPINTVQTDDKGKYVYVMVVENGKKIARKRQVAVGEIYGEQIEVKQGLQSGDQLITEGFQGLYEGQVLTTDVK
jgi:membrane fusion protein, multidrug efflux system